MSFVPSQTNHTTHRFSNPKDAKRHELYNLMLDSFREGIGEIDAEVYAAINKGYNPIRQPSTTHQNLPRALLEQLEESLGRILELQEQGNFKNGNSTDDAIARIATYLQKQAYLTGTATRRAEWGENLVLVVYRETGTKDCAKYVGKVFVDDVYQDGEMYRSPSGYRSWYNPAGRFARRGRYPLLSSAIDGGLYHYGCKCWHVSYFEGITELDYMGERLPSFVDYTTINPLQSQLDYDLSVPQEDSIVSRINHSNALYAVRQYLLGMNTEPTARRGFIARHNRLYERGVPAPLHERIVAYMNLLLGEGFDDTHEAFAIYHALLSQLSSHMIGVRNLDPSGLTDDIITQLLYNLFSGNDGQSFDVTQVDDNYIEFKRMYIFLQNFDDNANIDIAFVQNFLHHMDSHPDVVVRHTARLDNQRDQVLVNGANAVLERMPHLSQAEAEQMYWMYRWATTSNMTYEMGRRHQGFGLLGASLISGNVFSVAARTINTGTVSSRVAVQPNRRLLPSNRWTLREGSPQGLYWYRDSEFNFSPYSAAHMEEPWRSLPIQTLRDAIRHGTSFPDPRGTTSNMYYITMTRNGKLYNLEVLYDSRTNTIWHFRYTERAIGPLPAIRQ